MKINKKIALILAMSLTVASFTSCGNNKKRETKLLDSQNPTTIYLWHYYNGIQQTTFDNLVNEFNETVGVEQGIIVETSATTSISELSNKVLSALREDVGAEKAPDIFASYAETAYIADEMGCVADINQYFTDEELSEYIDEYISEGYFDDSGELKIFPTAKSTEVMILNATDWKIFSDATGVTTDDLTTWESLIEVSEKYYNYTDELTPDIENDGKAFFGRDSIANYMLVGAKELGEEFIATKNGKNEININKETIKKTMGKLLCALCKWLLHSTRAF